MVELLGGRPEPSRLYRWTVLLFVSVAMGGNYYIYDSINPLERIFIDKLGFSATAFGWLNSSYSVAAVLTLLIGGIIIDRIGTKKAITFFATLCLLGAALTAARGRPGSDDRRPHRAGSGRRIHDRGGHDRARQVV